jgi:hypothetical protein
MTHGRRFDPWRLLGTLLCVASAVVTVVALWALAGVAVSMWLGWPR